MIAKIERLIDMKPNQLVKEKKAALMKQDYIGAKLVQDFIDHCIISSRLIKRVLNS
tara:strand:- start:37206 stop:37373 length:168 start_codon:yes stop_codon:yes gene_type:complete